MEKKDAETEKLVGMHQKHTIVPGLLLFFALLPRTQRGRRKEVVMKNRVRQLKNEGRIYVCHTYYQAYVSILKELNLPEEMRGTATLMLSTMSTDFETFQERVESTGIFRDIVMYEERRDFPQLEKYRQDRGNIFLNMLSRIRYTRALAKLNEPLVPVDMMKYRDIYVFCDADPIGYYLNWKKIPYHACEDATNTIVYYDEARHDNKGHFGLKAFLSSKFNLILVQNGYAKYCIDMEVNDIAAIEYPCPKYIEARLEDMEKGVREKDRHLILQAFVRNREELLRQIREGGEERDKILILTEPLCSLEVRERLFRDLAEKYSKEGIVYFKQHPRDQLDYKTLFAEYPQFDANVPMEVLNYFSNLHFKKVVGIWTEMGALRFADEIVRLGAPFMDKYEDPEIHRDAR